VTHSHSAPEAPGFACAAFLPSSRRGTIAGMTQFDHVTDTLLTLIQIAVAIGLFIWFMNWKPKSILDDYWRERRRQLLDPLGDDPPVKPPAPTPDAKSESNRPDAT
jgi:hypothetical protein